MNPIFDATCADHGLFPVERPLGAVRTLALTRLCDVCGSAYDGTCTGELHDIAALISGAFAALCYRCDGPEAGRIDPAEPDDGLCRACRGEVESARQTIQWMRAGFDLDSGRIDVGRWGW